MNREEIHKLIGGYATGTLTAEERQALFAAALEDQELFDALANEQPLHDLLKDGVARAHLIDALEPQTLPWYTAWLRPALAAGALAGIALMAILVFRGKQPSERVEVAQVRELAPAPLAAQPNLKEFHPPPPASAPRQKPKIASPPHVISPKLERRALALPDAPLAPPAAPPAQLFAETEKVQAASGVVGGLAGAQPSEPAARMKANSMMMRTAAPLEMNRFGIRYKVLRKQTNGEFTVVDPKELVKGDSVEMQFEADVPASISVEAVDEAGASHVVAAGILNRNAHFTTPVLPQDVSTFRVLLIRSNPQAISGFLDKDAATPAVTPTDARDRATLVVAPPNWRTLTIPITLTYR